MLCGLLPVAHTGCVAQGSHANKIQGSFKRRRMTQPRRYKALSTALPGLFPLVLTDRNCFGGVLESHTFNGSIKQRVRVKAHQHNHAHDDSHGRELHSHENAHMEEHGHVDSRDHCHEHEEDCGHSHDHEKDTGYSHEHEKDCGHSHDHEKDTGHSHNHEKDTGQSHDQEKDCGHSHDHEKDTGHCHGHSHDHSHDHSHGHSHPRPHSLGCCHNHCVPDGQPKSLPYTVLRTVLGSVGVLEVSHKIEHSALASVISVLCLILSSLLGFLGGGVGSWVAAAGLVVVFVLSGIPLLVDSLMRTANGDVDTHVLMCLAVFGSLYLGLPHEGALLLVLFQVSHMLEETFTERAESSLESLLNSVPDTATVVELNANGQPEMSTAQSVKAEDVAVGTYILVKPGEQVTLDGIVEHGRASVTVDHISGESLPVRVKQGNEVAAGSRNNDGLLVIATTQTAQNSTPARIAKLAMDARLSRPGVQRWVDNVTTTWSRGVLLASVVAAGVCLLLGIPLLGPRGAVYRAMGIVTAAAPCALVLTPLAYVCALANATKRRILIKGAAVLDSILTCNMVGLDKTGTLTKGDLTCTAIISRTLKGKSDPQNGSTNSVPQDEHALQCALALSQRSSHPVSRAILEAGRKLRIDDSGISVTDFQLVPGAGVTGTVEVVGKKSILHFGSLDYVKEILSNEEMVDLDRVVAELGGGKSVSVLAEFRGLRLLGWHVFCFEDQLRADSAEAVKSLQMGTWRNGAQHHTWEKNVVMLTGDSASSANRIASTLGISEVHSELKPEDKLEYIRLAQEHVGNDHGNGFMMVGDGMNDAPALSAADVGVAIASTASDASASVADVVILNGLGVRNLPFLMKLAHETRAVVAQNLFLTFASMVVATVPTVGGLFPLWLAVFLHEGTTLLTALNSLRLLMIQPEGFSSKVPVSPQIGQVVLENELSPVGVLRE